MLAKLKYNLLQQKKAFSDALSYNPTDNIDHIKQKPKQLTMGPNFAN